MLEKFEEEKKYIFDKEIALANDEYLRINYEIGHATYWVDFCDGKEVEVLNEDEGIVDDNDNFGSYYIHPNWCKEV